MTDTTAPSLPMATSRRLLSVTPAKLASFEACPLRYRMTYLDRPPAPPGPPFAHTGVGSAVHGALRELADVEPPARTNELVTQLVSRAWTGLGFRSREDSRSWLAVAASWVWRYQLSGRLGRPHSVERTVAATTAQLAIAGRVDRLDLRGEDLAVVDYKCGRHPPAPGEAAASRQLALYAIAAGHTLRRDCRRVELHHLPTGVVQTHEHDAQSLQRHVHRAEALAGDLATAVASADFPARPGPLCGWCDLRVHCPAGRVSQPAKQPWDGLAYPGPCADPPG